MITWRLSNHGSYIAMTRTTANAAISARRRAILLLKAGKLGDPGHIAGSVDISPIHTPPHTKRPQFASCGVKPTADDLFSVLYRNNIHE
jgi:hypothetical protein